ncbi:NAD(P)-binding protein [Cylindrobasidium torrendii FP15055 ss-10]|uniref:NAD(P)-binding protein n=1 Tax=Cylindrobasidium torrendii FP15055 ss-10 TaxID=1314674 RepID=A0A0D7AVB2_9AGAR|nr:NAD(P)-binding protein [Cylindrobasidium torrendii FP15055 ss-10]
MVVRTVEDTWADHKSERPPPVVTSDLTGKTIIVTGANVGLGFEACKHFATMNPKRLILACRDQEKGRAALADIGYAAAETWPLDLGSLRSVVSFADRVQDELERLDVLILNAGVINFEWGLTEDGYERTLQVNGLSNLLLAVRLAPLLLKTAKAHNSITRLVNVTSEMLYYTGIDSALLKSQTNVYKAMSEKEFCVPPDWNNRYPQTKLIELFYTRSLQAYIGQDAPLVVTCLNPGYCYSNFRANAPPGVKQGLEDLEKEYAYTTEEGSRQLVFGAVNDDPEALKGQYFSMCKVREVSDYALSDEGWSMERRFWDDGIEILGEKDEKFKAALAAIARVTGIRGMQEVREDHEKMQRALEAAEAALATARKDTQAERERAEGYKAQLGELEGQATTEAEWQKKARSNFCPTIIVAFESRWDAFCDVFEEGYRNLRTEYLELVGLKPHVSNKKRKSAEIIAGPSTVPTKSDSVSVNSGPSHTIQPRRKFHRQEPTPSASADDRDPPTSSPRDRPELSINIPTEVDLEGSLSPLTSPEPDSPVPETKRKRNMFEDTIVDVSAKRTLRPQTSSAPSRPTWNSLKR